MVAPVRMTVSGDGIVGCLPGVLGSGGFRAVDSRKAVAVVGFQKQWDDAAAQLQGTDGEFQPVANLADGRKVRIGGNANAVHGQIFQQTKGDALAIHQLLVTYEHTAERPYAHLGFRCGLIVQIGDNPVGG